MDEKIQPEKRREEFMTLRDLEPGDIFRHARSRAKQPDKFVVIGLSEFNRAHGSATRLCQSRTGLWLHKSCRLEVIKISESIHKQTIIEEAKAKKEVKK